MRKAGLVPQRIWVHRLYRQWDPASFWARATGMGVSRHRLGLIDPDARAGLLARLRDELSGLATEDYRWEGEVICAVATKPRVPPAALLP
jgi:hypothetical protein